MRSNASLLFTPLLFTPGPTPSPEFLRVAMSVPTLHHRTQEFESIFRSAQESLIKMTKMSDVLMLASSGTGAMEACVSNFSSTKILSVNSGKFGERFGEIGRALGREVVEIKNQWDTPVSVESVLENLDSNIECVVFQICESAGGLSHPYSEVARAVKEYDSRIFVVADAITAMGVEDIDVTHIDALIGGSQKAFMLPPGLSIIALSEMALKHLESKGSGYYFNLKKELQNQCKNTTAYTATTSIIIGLKAYFDMLDSQNLSFKDMYAYTAKIATATRASLESIGLKIYPKVPANSMSVVIDQRAKEILQTLKSEFKITLADGQDRLKNKIFRINHMGYIPLHEIVFVLNAIELSLDMLGVRKFSGEGNEVFFKKIYTT